MTKKMLDVSILQDNNIRYNDDIAYVEGDDVYTINTSEDAPTTYTNSENYSNYIVYQLGTQTYSPSIKNSEIDYTPTDLKYLTSLVECRNLTLTKADIETFTNVLVTDYDEISEDMFNCLKEERYDGVCYYAQSDTLVIPQVINHYLEKDGQVSVYVTIYNLDVAIKQHPKFEKCNIADKPSINFSYIPNKIKYSKFDIDTISGQVPAPQPSDDELYFDFNYIYMNLPKEYYKYIAIDSRTLAYDVNEKSFYGHSNSNQTKINALCKDIAMHGLKSPIQLKLLSDGTLASYFSNKRLLAALYLNYPTIPVCIIYEPYVNNRNLYYYIPTPNIEEMNKLLYPHIILDV